jgi:hypothetical protein
MFDLDVVAKQAYDIADAMLRERGAAVRDNCVSGNNPEIGCPPAITDEEREAIESAVSRYEIGEWCGAQDVAATLRSLLGRLR